MLEWISWFVIGVIYNVIDCLLFSSLNKVDKNVFRILILSILFSFLNSIGIMNFSNILNLIMNIMSILLLFKITFNISLQKTIVTTLLIYIGYAIAELLFVIFFVILLRLDQSFLRNELYGIYISNISVTIIRYFLYKSKLIKNIYNFILSWYLDKKVLNTIILSTLSIISIGSLLYKNYIDINSLFSFIITNIFLLGIIVFILGFFKEKTNNNKLTSEYDQLLQYVKTYEEVIEEKSKNQHEYQNQLILIKEMLGTKNKKVRDHISELLEIEDQTEKYNWLNKLKNIPNGGLKGLIHYKITEMMKKDIKLYVDINDNVNNKRINKYLNDNLHDISKIIGVYIDNAIEAAVDSKQRYIIIEAMIENNKLDFSVSNTYSGTIDFNSIDKEGYSKKGKGRGYGLSLVQDIINRRKDIDQYREFNGIFFVQKTTFQYKK